MWRLPSRIVLALVVGGWSTGGANAQGSARTLQQLYHTEWTLRDGAPADVAALAQTADGFLWLGTTTGLYRFDGVRFERYERAGQPLPSNNVATLLALPDSSLWIGYRFGGFSRLTRTDLANFGEGTGCPPGTVSGLARDRAGVMWIATSNGLNRFIDGRCTRIGAEHGLPVGYIHSIKVDRRGTIWAATFAGVFNLPAKATTFIRRAPTLGDGDPGALAESPDGSVWGASTVAGPVRLSTPTGAEPARNRATSAALRSSAFGLSGVPAETMLIGSDGALWIGAIDRLERSTRATEFAARANTPELPQHMARIDGLSGNTVTSMLEDRENNIWVATEGGLDRFRVAKLTTVAVPGKLLAPVIVPDTGRTVWAASLVTPMMKITDGAVDVAGSPHAIESVARARDGTIWLGGRGRLFHTRRDGFDQVPLPASASASTVQAIAEDRSGSVWISVLRQGVFRRTGAVWKRVGASWGLDTTAAVSIVADSSGSVWLGYTRSRVVQVRGDSARTFATAQGLTVGNVTALVPLGDSAWVGGEFGLAQVTRNRVTRILAEGNRPFRGVSGIVQREQGELWLNGADGITRIPVDEVAHALRDTAYRVRAELLDSRDGLDGIAPQLRPLPSAVAGSDGRIWFVSGSSIFWIDPRAVHRNTLAPPVGITALEADDHVFSADSTPMLPRGTTAVRIRYTALSLAIPERVRFRYKLDGIDKTWQDGGVRREASYANLGAGKYGFRVIASNDDGVWNEAGAVLTFVIPPTFVQTRTFAALSVISAGMLLWILFQYRQRRVVQAMRARFDVTLAERTRIAQELHDTLLQNFMGITLQLHTVERLLGARPSDAAAMLSRAIAHAQSAVREARRAVWNMRSPQLAAQSFTEALADVGRTAIGDRAIELRVDVSGTPQPLSADVENVLLRVTGEAVTNSVAHAEPSEIAIKLIYQRASIGLSVRDDGLGFSTERADCAEQSGHWGLVGMKERAAAVNGTIDIASTMGEGTIVTLVVPIRESEPTIVR